VDAGLTVSPFLTLQIPQLCKVRFARLPRHPARWQLSLPVLPPLQGFAEGIAMPMLQQLSRALPFVADVSLPFARANAAEWGRLGASPEAAAADALGATMPPERPHIGATALACAAEHSAARARESAASRAAPMGAPPLASSPVAVL